MFYSCMFILEFSYESSPTFYFHNKIEINNAIASLLPSVSLWLPFLQELGFTKLFDYSCCSVCSNTKAGESKR